VNNDKLSVNLGQLLIQEANVAKKHYGSDPSDAFPTSTAAEQVRMDKVDTNIPVAGATPVVKRGRGRPRKDEAPTPPVTPAHSTSNGGSSNATVKPMDNNSGHINKKRRCDSIHPITEFNDPIPHYHHDDAEGNNHAAPAYLLDLPENHAKGITRDLYPFHHDPLTIIAGSAFPGVNNGFGCFANTNFIPGDIIGEYLGLSLDIDVATSKLYTSTYVCADWDSRITIDAQSGREGGWKILCTGGYINVSLNGV
jgi:hypothetical protein